MFKITLRVYRDEFAALYLFLPNPTGFSLRAMAAMRLEEIILIDYRGRITPQQVLTWKMRPTNKRFALTISLQVARALWSELQLNLFTPELQGLLSELDQQLKNLH